MKLRNDLAALLPQLREQDLYKFCQFHEKYAPHLATIGSGLYDRLNAEDQARFLVWFLKRWGKIDLVNAIERGLYEATIDSVKQQDRPLVSLGETPYRLLDFKPQGHDFKLLGYDWVLGVHDVLYNQYEHGDVRLEADDVIIDAGAFIGDTAVYFHHKLGGRCKIHSFELLDENLALLVHNLERNGVADDCIVLNKLALAGTTGDEIVVNGGHAQSATSILNKPSQGERVQTITLDDYVLSLKLTRVDFIKMDIEGAEAMALKGARQTIQHFKPKLAICLYHKWDDVFTLPPLIDATGVDYTFAFKWVQLTDGWEAVLLATPTARVAKTAAAVAPLPTAVADPLADALSVLSKAYIKKWGQADALWREQRQAQKALPARSAEAQVAVAE